MSLLQQTQLPTYQHPELSMSPEISVVVPIYNEYENIEDLVNAITENMDKIGRSYEILCVDDGSKDGSAQLLKDTALTHPTLRAILLRRNYGQTPAMAAGFKHARGKIIVTLDGDLQNPPSEIYKVLNKLEGKYDDNEGYDLVSGWRKKRQDKALTRLLPSKIANWLIGRLTGVKLHDYGCSLKAYRCEVLRDMNLYGELHRFLPALAYIEGAKIEEIPVEHRARARGQSKYGLGRTFRVILDLFTVYFMKKFLTRPMHVFGLWGFISLAIGVFLGLYLTLLKFVANVQIGDRPLLILSVLLTLTGIQLFCFGLLGELLMRTYHESQDRPIYRVREIIGAGEEGNSSRL